MKIVNLLYIAPLAVLSVFLKSCLKTEASTYSLHLHNQTKDELYVLNRWDCEYMDSMLRRLIYAKILLCIVKRG